MRSLIRQLALTMPPRSVHVVGSNGKGTVAAMTAAALQAAGRRVGRFLSPHVEDFRERIAVDGEGIPPSFTLRFLEDLRSRPEVPEATFFELGFALALEYFDQQEVEVAVVEAGVGARGDATMALDNVEAVVITNVALDHLRSLGSSLEDIALDKSAAIRPRIPVITGCRGDALSIIAREARQCGSPLYSSLATPELFELPEALREVSPISMGVRRSNQRLAAAVLRVLRLITETAIATGLQSPPLPARAERFLVGGCQVLLDGAHNPAAATALATKLERPYVLVFGALPGKQAEATLRPLEVGAGATIITRAGEEDTPVSRLRRRRFIADPLQALAYARTLCDPGDMIVVAGSFRLAGAVRPFLRKSVSLPARVAG